MSDDGISIIGGAGYVEAHLSEIRAFGKGCRSAAQLLDQATGSLGAALHWLEQAGAASGGLGWTLRGAFDEALGRSQHELSATRRNLLELGDAAMRTIDEYSGAERYGRGLFSDLRRGWMGLSLEFLTRDLLWLAGGLGAVLRAADNPSGVAVLTEEKYTGSAPPVHSVADAVGRTGLRHPDGNKSADGHYRIQIDKIVQPDGTVAWQVFLPGMQAFGINENAVDTAGVLAAVGGGETDATRAIDQALQEVGAKKGESVMLAGHSAGGMAVTAFAATEAAKKYSITSVITAGSPVRLMKKANPGAQVLHLEHEDDFVPHLDGGPTDPDDHVTIVSSPSMPAPEIDKPGAKESLTGKVGDPHRTPRYRELGKWVDEHESEPSLDAFKAAMALSLPKAGARVTTREFVLKFAPIGAGCRTDGVRPVAPKPRAKLCLPPAPRKKLSPPEPQPPFPPPQQRIHPVELTKQPPPVPKSLFPLPKELFPPEQKTFAPLRRPPWIPRWGEPG